MARLESYLTAAQWVEQCFIYGLKYLLLSQIECLFYRRAIEKETVNAEWIIFFFFKKMSTLIKGISEILGVHVIY